MILNHAQPMCVQSAEQSRENFLQYPTHPGNSKVSGYLALYFGTYVIASLFIFLEEGWEPLDCIYFAVVTLTTAGLGDFVPTTDANKIIAPFSSTGVACIGLLLGLHCGNVTTKLS
jgi:hypothetical protein